MASYAAGVRPPRQVTTNSPVWEEGGWQPLPQQTGRNEADVVVVGLGGSGLAAVHRLLDAGLWVAGIDAQRVASGAAGGNGGFLLAGTSAFHHRAAAELGRERAADLYRLTIEEIGRMLEQGDGDVRRVGSLRIADSAEELEDCWRQQEAMVDDGLPVERYRGAEGEGLLFPGDSVFEPLKRCRQSARRALERGAQLFEQTEAVEIAGDRVVTRRGELHCKAVIVAVDGRLERLLPELAGRIRTARLQMLATAPTEEVSLPRPVYLRYGYDYYQQTAAGRIAIGGFRDRAGQGEWTTDPAPSQAVQRRLERFVRERLGVSAPITHRWAASVGYSGGVLPLLAEVRPRVWALGGYNGTGNVIGALLGRAAAELAAGGRSALAERFFG